MVWVILSIVTSLYFTGGSYLFALPALFAGIAGIGSLAIKSELAIPIRMVIPAAVAGILWLPNERIFYDAVGFSMNPILIFRVAIVLLLMLPLAFAIAPRIRTLVVGVFIALATAATLWAVLTN